MWLKQPITVSRVFLSFILGECGNTTDIANNRGNPNGFNPEMFSGNVSEEKDIQFECKTANGVTIR
ncbi:MAG: hypothetical protein K5986_07985 [Clostridium sp.]|uniref:hypothetical protein n=1 Tax=Clostridium sp. DSM 8431 TaxID=1761781 RepID=UPI001113B83D|nr:hypothetical protein [Clostridium sp. DSM 8431]MCR4944372.1 hypothetical protein [Clostridium sp.]